MLIKKQNFGVEIELTGITRRKAAETIAEYYGTTSSFLGTSYNTYGAKDSQGRIWKAMYDGSIQPTRKENGRQVVASRDYSCEIVTPILTYKDIEDLQKIVRLLVSKGAVTNASCGIHVHVDGKRHSPESLTRLINFACGRQDLFYEALGIEERANRWCKKVSRNLLLAMKADAEKSKHSMEAIWYSRANDNYTGGIDHAHYNPTRYHGINLHSFFTKGTVEFRLFNGTTHAGKIKAYVQFCLAMSAWAIEAESAPYFKSCSGYTREQKAVLMKNVLTRRLGLCGPEFKTARQHLISAFTEAEAA